MNSEISLEAKSLSFRATARSALMMWISAAGFARSISRSASQPRWISPSSPTVPLAKFLEPLMFFLSEFGCQPVVQYVAQCILPAKRAQGLHRL